MFKKILVVATAIAILSVIAYLNFNLQMCSFSRGEDDVRHLLSMATAIITLVIFTLYAHFTNKKNALLIIFIFPFVGAVLFTSVHTHKKSAHYLNSFDGEVTRKYISDNHASKLFSVNGSDHGATKNIWVYLNVGDIVSKKQCSNNITINGKVHTY